jgi:hypothetical protein
MGRRRGPDKERIFGYVSCETIAKVRLLLVDNPHLRPRARYGDFSRLLDQLLADWVALRVSQLKGQEDARPTEPS